MGYKCTWRLTFFFGFRDSRHEIRALCIAEMGEWMKEYRWKLTSIMKNEDSAFNILTKITELYMYILSCLHLFAAHTFWVISFWSTLFGVYMIRWVLLIVSIHPFFPYHQYGINHRLSELIKTVTNDSWLAWISAVSSSYTLLKSFGSVQVLGLSRHWNSG